MGRFSSLMSNPLDWLLGILISVPAILIAFSFHEFAHAWAAVKMGDNTPRFMGRFTINPLKHIDWWGFFLLLFVGFGWGKPVMVQPNNFKERRKGEFLVAIAGVTMNLILGIISCLLAAAFIVFVPGSASSGGILESIGRILFLIPLYNFVIMIFNLIPVPPLDGSKVLSTIFWRKYPPWLYNLERYGFLILIGLSFLGAFDFISSASYSLFSLFLRLFAGLFGVAI